MLPSEARIFTVYGVQDAHLGRGVLFVARNKAVGLCILQREPEPVDGVRDGEHGERRAWGLDAVRDGLGYGSEHDDLVRVDTGHIASRRGARR